MEERFRVVVRGVSPLLMHRMSNEPNTKSKKSGATYDNDKLAEEALYKDDKGKVCQPALHFESAMIKSATNYRIPGQGKKTFKDAFKGGIFVEPSMIKHKFPKWEVDLQSVVIQRARIIRARPRFDKWELEFTILCIDERITEQTIKDVLSDVGKFAGIGDFRPRFGRFEVIKFEKLTS